MSVSRSGAPCPFCAGVDVAKAGFDLRSTYRMQKFFCRACKRKWNDGVRVPLPRVDFDVEIAPQEPLEKSRLCPKCGTGKLIKMGVSRRCNPPRQKFWCKDCRRQSFESKSGVFTRHFIADPEKLRRAVALLREGALSMHEVAQAAGLDRYTVYKLKNILGEIVCACGRRLGHRGPCKPRFDRHPKSLVALNANRLKRTFWGLGKAEESMAAVLKAIDEVTKGGVR